MTKFATPEELKTYIDGGTLNVNTEVDPATGADIEWYRQASLMLDMIGADIQSAARSPIIQPEAGETVTLVGTWSQFIELPRRPVVSVTSVRLNDHLVSSPGFRWNEKQLVRQGVGFIGGHHESLSNYDHGLSWGGPSSSVTVEYLYGYDPADVPEFIKSLSLRIASRVIENPSGLTQQTLGAYSESYGKVLDGGGSHVSAAEAKMLRKRFSKTAGTFGAGR